MSVVIGQVVINLNVSNSRLPDAFEGIGICETLALNRNCLLIPYNLL